LGRRSFLSMFQGRFKSLLVEKDSHLLELSRYVVLNPVRAGLVKCPSDWLWSSYRVTAGIGKAPAFLSVDWMLHQFGKTKKEARSAIWILSMRAFQPRVP
jgi:putative transposase